MDFPRSLDRGFIEGRLVPGLILTPGYFPRSLDRGFIEGKQTPRENSFAPIFPRSLDRGFIEGVPSLKRIVLTFSLSAIIRSRLY